jgi:hypothetical protein
MFYFRDAVLATGRRYLFLALLNMEIILSFVSIKKPDR